MTAKLSRSSTFKDVQEELNCSICFEEYTDPTLTLCGHLFCFSCLEEAKLIRDKCPTCNTTFPDNDKGILVYSLSFLERHDSLQFSANLDDEIKSEDQYEAIFNKMLKKKSIYVLPVHEKIWEIIKIVMKDCREVFCEKKHRKIGVCIVAGLSKAISKESKKKSILWRHTAQLSKEINLRVSYFMQILTIFNELNFYYNENIFDKSRRIFKGLVEKSLLMDKPNTIESAYNVCYYLRAGCPFYNDITSKYIQINSDWLLLWLEALFSSKNYDPKSRLELWKQLDRLSVGHDLISFVKDNEDLALDLKDKINTFIKENNLKIRIPIRNTKNTDE